MSNFAFLLPDFPGLHAEAALAENSALSDPRVCCLYARRTLEGTVKWLYANDPAFGRPYDTTLNGLMNSSDFEACVPNAVRLLAHSVRKMSNASVHESRAVKPTEALAALRDLFGFLHWFAATYRTRNTVALPKLFDEKLLPESVTNVVAKSLADVKVLEEALKKQTEEAEKQRLEGENAKAELEALRLQVAARKANNLKAPVPLVFSEEETRYRLIDRMLSETGWNPHGLNVREYKCEAGRVDYVLWGADGLPLAVVEVKKTSRDPRVGQKQALDYAEALEKSYGRLPVIFYSNGVETYLWDKARGYPPRKVSGFYNREDLELMIQRRKTAGLLSEFDVNKDIADRYYQETAIRKVTDRFETRQRRGLLVMATGTGKTRVTIALIELLMRSNWVKRVLFLADRNALVRQAKKSFTRFYPAANAVNLVEDKDVMGARVVLSTYHTMMNQLDAGTFSAGHFDLIIVDEAHRSIYSKFGAIFDYFDGLLLGLTATPRDDVDRNTYKLFDIHDGVPIFEYSLDQAVRDTFLVPFVGKKVESQFLRDGIKYDALSDDDKAQYDDIEWDEYGGRREEIQNTELYKWLFNANTVDKVLQTLMEHGYKTATGDEIGKTIIFAQSIDHAKFIQERFDKNYPYLAGSYAQTIANGIERADQLVDEFCETATPRIAISVDMLDTGIDVPEIVNLVFFRRVQSKTKFWQMIGRGTRLRKDLFGAGQDKKDFLLLDFCGNLEFFNIHPKGIESKPSMSLEQRLFHLRLDILQLLAPVRDDTDNGTLYALHADTLHERVCGMPEDNFLVRPHLELIERFAKREAWDDLSRLDVKDLKDRLAPLPTAILDKDEDAKRFDSLVFQATLGVLEGKARKGVRGRIEDLCSGLEKKQNVPQVKVQLLLIRAVQTPEFWQDVSAFALEHVRQNLRDLMVLLDRDERTSRLETDFADVFAAPELLELTGVDTGVNKEAYQKKVRAFIEAQKSHPVIQKIRQAEPLGESDVKSLEQLLFSARELESRETFEWAYGKEANLGKFIRTLVGMDRAAAKRAFSKYLDGKTFSSDQIEFVNYLVEMLTENGVVDKRALFESPFTDVHVRGLEGLFTAEESGEILRTLERVNTITLVRSAPVTV
jgi:type I restriction enzyme R subunit